MSDAAGVRPRARQPVSKSGRKSPWPWDDRAGRFSWLKAAALVLQAIPAAYLAWAWATGGLGPRPVTELIHGTGQMAIRFLLISLAISPAKALFNWTRATLIRRQLGLTALFYALAHLALYSLDLKWAWWHIASEIALRFYLTIGFVALVGLAALGLTSTDGAVRRMGRRWKQLHRLAYPLAAVVAFHFFLQSKADVSEATLMAGMLFWLMGWRLLPSGADRAPLPVLGLGLAAAALTAVAEYAWFALGTKVDPARPLLAELDWTYAPHPAGQILLLGLGVAVATALAWAGRRERLRASLGYQVALYAGAAAIAAAVAFAFSLTDSWLPEDWAIGPAAAGFVAAAALLGVGRWAWPTGRRVLDGVCAALVLTPVALGLAL